METEYNLLDLIEAEIFENGVWRKQTVNASALPLFSSRGKEIRIGDKVVSKVAYRENEEETKIIVAF